MSDNPYENEDDAGLDKPGQEMLAQLVQANVDAATHAANAIIKGIERQRDELAQAFCLMYERLSSIDKDSMSVTVFNILQSAAIDYGIAEDYVHNLLKDESY